MQSFPFDNANESDTSQCVSSDILADYYNEMNGKVNGIYSELGNKGLVVAGTGMTVKVMPVNGIVKGRLFKEDAERVLIVQASEALDRIDSIVIRQNKAVPSTDLYVIKGTSGTAPIAPAPIRTGDIYDLVIAQIFIAKSTTTIAQSRITDTRLNTMLCGLVAVPTMVDVNSVFNQYQAALDEYLVLVEKSIDGTMAGHLQELITGVKAATVTAQSTANSAYNTAAAALPRASFESYNTMSTVEHWTGRYDTDGKKIYAKTIRTGNVGSVSETNIAHNVSNINPNGYRYITARASINKDNNYDTMVPSTAVDGNFLRQISFGLFHPALITIWHNYGNRWVSYIIYLEYTCTDR